MIPGGSCPKTSARRSRPRSLTCVASIRTVKGCRGPTCLLRASSCRHTGTHVQHTFVFRC
jgi:hypothetical protein